MKYLFFILTVAVVLTSCSSDDDSNLVENENLTQTEILVNGSPWNFNNVEVITVERNDLELTNEELKNISQQNTFPQFIFNSNGTVLISNNGNEITADFIIVNNNMTLIAPDNSEFELINIEISESEFSYEQQFDAIGDNTSISSFWTSRIFFN